MGKRSRRRGRTEIRAGVASRASSVPAPIGIADYAPEDWRRIVAASAAPEEEDDTHEDWREARDRVIAVLTSRGVRARLVPVSADRLFDWLKEKGLPNLSRHRVDYVVELIRTGRDT